MSAKYWFKKTFKKLHTSSIQGKIFFICLIIAFSTIIISLLISYYAQESTIKNTTTNYMEQYLSNADNGLNEMINDAKKISLSIAIEKEIVYPTLLNPSAEASYDWYKEKKKVESYLSGLAANKDYIKSIAIITEKQQIYQVGYDDNTYKKYINHQVITEVMKQNKLKIIYNREDKQRILLCRPIQYSKKVMAVSIIEINYDSLINVYNVEPLQSVQVFIYTPDEKLLLDNRELEDIKMEQNNVRPLVTSKSDSGFIQMGGKKLFFIRYTSDISLLTTICLIPYQTLIKDATSLKSNFIGIGAFAVMLAFTASLILSTKICRNITILTNSMEDIQEGNIDARAQIQSQDEIGKLADTFNNMMSQIKLLMEEVQIKEKLRHEAEESVLAAQIQPHFLYNTLNSIQYMAHMNKETEIEKVTIALAELLRSVLGNRNEFITIWEERQYIEYYITIERFKYQNDFMLIWDVDEMLWPFPIPKLLLQPIVENALLHGISEKDQGGIINIKIYSHNDEIIFKITDNGKGMNAEIISRLLNNNGKEAGEFRHVGVNNVLSRIRMIYGTQYGGTIYSYPNMFTCVELHIPYNKKED